ncbi:MAG: tRNA lysidine(34) synthetase TilS [Betaproteobacteria bacterium AqS2]|uniref:tRNA(Ile)-lysidine synthase n=1 Tax=Candidatus Amphirhobacter heronislandensis TaxID=1732024 RepID=A0A930Y2V6_9GAMM|nr:tRNA lysidine(34) synthetase TilS [Betaproteobacteria bacterium AqS2]
MPKPLTEARAALRHSLAAALPQGGEAAVCFSGGLDSTVLLHLARAAAPAGVALRAIHVNHGLQPEADAWAARCRATASAWDIPCEVARAKVAARPAASLENRARQARLRIWRRQSCPVLLMAHHADDQAETVLLRALRGSGPHGLAAMRPSAPLPGGSQLLLRPLLACARRELEEYALAAGLDGVADPANRDLRHNRNWLRHELLPALEQRFPGAGAALRRSAELARESGALLDELAAADDETCRSGPARYSRAALRRLGWQRAKNWLRWSIVRAGRQPPQAAHLEEAARQLCSASAGFGQRFGPLELQGTGRHVSWRPAAAGPIGRIAVTRSKKQSKQES